MLAILSTSITTYFTLMTSAVLQQVKTCDLQLKVAKQTVHTKLLQITYTNKKINCEVVSFQAQQLNVKDEGGVRRDDARVAFVSISVVR